MPVIRQPIQVNDTRSIQPVQMPDNPMGRVVEKTAQYAIIRLCKWVECWLKKLKVTQKTLYGKQL